MTYTVRRHAFVLALMTAIPAGTVGSALGGLGCGSGEPCDEPYSCPEQEWIDCMPPYVNDNNECVGECHEWIVGNCPDAKFAW